MDKKSSVSCRPTAYSVDHNVIREAKGQEYDQEQEQEQEEAVIEAYHDESEWAERNQAAVHPDFITQKS